MKENQVLEKSEEIKEQEVAKNENLNENYNVKKKKINIGVGILICVFAIILITFLWISIKNNLNKNIIKGIKVDNVDLSNMSLEEGRDKLNNYINTRLNNNIKFNYEEYNVEVNPLDIGITYNVEEAINEAYNVGRNENIFCNNFNVIKTNIKGKKIDLKTTINEEKFNSFIKEINGNLSNGVQQPSYYIEKNDLIITAGKEGISVNEEEFKKIILEKINTEVNNEEKVTIPVKIIKPNDIDIDNIYKEVHKEAQDAYITKDPFEIHPHVEGVEFSISIDEVKTMLQEKQEKYTIPLKITKPKVTTDSLGDEAFPNRLATYSTKYSTADVNRTTNIKISVNKINGVVLLPGEEFSYNKVLGPRTPQAGYKLGAAYIGGKVVSDYGGGVCQTSSTLYNAVLLSNLEITSRTSHYFAAAYVPVSRDATVYWPSLDFKFKNNRKYPIKIKAYTSNGVIKVEIFGTAEGSDYEVELQSYVTSYIPYNTEYKDDNTLPEGKEVVEQAGTNGIRSEAYKILKKDGKVISKTLLSRDTYSTKARIIRRGTKKTEQKQQSKNSNIQQNDEQEKKVQEDSTKNIEQEKKTQNDTSNSNTNNQSTVKENNPKNNEKNTN
ncbi:MAG TPA: VanW family protein [Clostridiaceae bacterium]|nr:VanW family protein [Clostridiaceae bacterium]